MSPANLLSNIGVAASGRINSTLVAPRHTALVRKSMLSILFGRGLSLPWPRWRSAFFSALCTSGEISLPWTAEVSQLGEGDLDWKMKSGTSESYSASGFKNVLWRRFFLAVSAIACSRWKDCSKCEGFVWHNWWACDELCQKRAVLSRLRTAYYERGSSCYEGATDCQCSGRCTAKLCANHNNNTILHIRILTAVDGRTTLCGVWAE